MERYTSFFHFFQIVFLFLYFSLIVFHDRWKRQTLVLHKEKKRHGWWVSILSSFLFPFSFSITEGLRKTIYALDATKWYFPLFFVFLCRIWREHCWNFIILSLSHYLSLSYLPFFVSLFPSHHLIFSISHNLHPSSYFQPSPLRTSCLVKE